MVTMVFVAALESSVLAGEILAPANGFATNHVASGASVTQDARVLIDSASCAYKLGTGTWTIPLSFLQPWVLNFGVLEGTFAFGMGASAGSYTAPTTLPASIADKALIWVDAADPVVSHIAAAGNAVSCWYDRREGADVSSPTYCRARSYTSYTSDLPTFVQLGGTTNAIYFGGLGSGQTMEFILPNGTRFNQYGHLTGVRHVFAVHMPSSTYGTLFGTFTSNPTPFRRGGSKPNTVNHFYWESDSTWAELVNGRTYLNGERIDGTLATVKSSLQLLEAERFHTVANVVGGLFAATSTAGCGGDYICEAIAFTNRLSDAERLVVTEYLMAKWLPDVSGRKISVSVADGASFAVDATAGSVDLRNTVFSGNGEISVTGTGAITFGNTSSVAFDGTLTLDGGKATLLSPAALAISGGGTLSVENTATGPEMSFSADASSKLVKTGKDLATIPSVPAGVTRVAVQGGTLAVREASQNQAEDIYAEVPIRNGGFEEYASKIDELAAGKGVLTYSAVTIADGGWQYAWNGSAYVVVMDWERWTGNDLDNTTKSAWNFNTHPPEGKCALVMRAVNADDAIARSQAFTLTAGTYELRVSLCGRQSTAYNGQIFRAKLIDGTANTEKARFGDVMFTDITGYTEFKLRTTVAVDGSYRFEFRSLGGRNGIIIADDVRLYKVTPTRANASTWRIPGGDFETDTFGMKTENLARFSVDHTHTNWTFTQSSTWTEGKRADIGITTICATNITAGHGTGVFFNNSRHPATGSMELCLAKSGCSATTTFTPPAGVWNLQGDIAQFGSYGVNPTVTATVTIGGETIDLGTIPAKTRLMKTFAWPASFAVDGTQEVTLTLTPADIGTATGSSSHGLLVDDLVLRSATGLNLFKDGSCEGYNGSWVLKAAVASEFGGNAGVCRVRPPSEAPAAFGTTVIDGKYMITIENLTAIYEDVYFPAAGRYRLSFYAHSRLNDKTGGYGPNPLRAWVAENGVTNVIGYADTYNSDWVQRVFDFNVSSPGTKRVAIQGCDNPENVKHIHEAHVDAISLRQIAPIANSTSLFPEKCRIAVAEGARLCVDFEGTNVIRSLRLGGVAQGGIVEVADHPDYLVGRGAFLVKPAGAVLSFK